MSPRYGAIHRYLHDTPPPNIIQLFHYHKFGCRAFLQCLRIDITWKGVLSIKSRPHPLKYTRAGHHYKYFLKRDKWPWSGHSLGAGCAPPSVFWHLLIHIKCGFMSKYFLSRFPPRFAQICPRYFPVLPLSPCRPETTDSDRPLFPPGSHNPQRP